MPLKKKKKVAPKKRALKKKPVKARRAVKKIKKEKKDKILGVVTHYFPQVRAAVIKLKSPLAVGEAIKIKGHTTEFTQTVDSMQIDRAPIDSAKKGQEIGLLVNSRVRQHDLVLKA